MRTWCAAAGGWYVGTPVGTMPAGMVLAGVSAARVAGMVRIVNIKALRFGHHARGHEKRVSQQQQGYNWTNTKGDTERYPITGTVTGTAPR